MRCWPLVLAGVLAPHLLGAQSPSSAPRLPDSPGTLLSRVSTPLATQQDRGDAPAVRDASATDGPPACPSPGVAAPPARPAAAAAQLPPCHEKQVQPILSAGESHPLSSRQKGELAVRDTVDPFNLLTIAGYSGFAVGFNAHSAYGPGFEGWGKLSGYSLLEDAQGEFFGTFLISSLAHEDPRYHRMPNATVKRRVLHALAHTWVTQSDDGRTMPNYATLLTYPISAELSNLYVPGVPTNLRDTGERVGIGLATDPSGTLLAEFLPDLAKRIHVHVIFIQEILNQVITGGTAPNVQ